MAGEATFQDALKRYGGMHGSVWQDGNCLYEIVEVAGAVEIGRIEVPLVGTTRVGYKTGRESREATMRVQKIDTKWELFVYQFLSQSLAARRAARGTPQATNRSFTLKLVVDDPEAGGKEVWQLEGCKIWRMTLGHSITDETIDREYPLTWEVETPLQTFVYDANGNVVPKNVVGGTGN